MQCTLANSISTHPISWILGATYVGSALVATMPKPGSPEPLRVLMYQWAYDALHVLLNQVDRLVASKYPQYAKLGTGSDVKLGLGLGPTEVGNPPSDPTKK